MAKLKGIAIAPQIMAPMEKCQEAEISVDAGILGDARGRKRERQITILFEDDWNDAVAEVGDGALEWVARRANLLVEGMRSPKEEGGIFTIGDARLEVVMETDPCELMESAKTGLKKALTPDWRGGVCCRVLAGGSIRLDDTVSYESRD